MNYLDKQRAEVEQWDDYAGWRQWLDSDPKALEDFEVYAQEHFWNLLGEDFLSQLHPDAAVAAADDLSTQWSLWQLFLWVVLEEERLRILVESFVDSNRDDFLGWIFQ